MRGVWCSCAYDNLCVCAFVRSCVRAGRVCRTREVAGVWDVWCVCAGQVCVDLLKICYKDTVGRKQSREYDLFQREIHYESRDNSRRQVCSRGSEYLQ